MTENLVEANFINESAEQESFNYNRVGSVRPSALMYTGGIGSTIDLPHFSVLVEGLESWDRYYERAGKIERVLEPRLLKTVQQILGPSINEMRKAPWMQDDGISSEANKIGVPVSLFPRWLRCTGCNLLSRSDDSDFLYINKNKFRPDQAKFVHKSCKGKENRSSKPSDRAVVPARFLLACLEGHIDEFPYLEWVHRATSNTWSCSAGAQSPKLEMIESPSNLGPQVQIKCRACGSKRTVQEAAGEKGEDKLPKCRGRHPHLGQYVGCQQQTKLMLLGASNQWFPILISLLVMPTMEKKSFNDIIDFVKMIPINIRATATSRETMPMLFMMVNAIGMSTAGISEDEVWKALGVINGNTQVQAIPVAENDANFLLIPEWEVMQNSSLFKAIAENSDFRLRSQGSPKSIASIVEEVVAVDRLKKVSAFLGFTRVDPESRIADSEDRVAPISRSSSPTWVPATEDKGEGVFLRFNEDAVANWESQILSSGRWQTLRLAHKRNFERRMSNTSNVIDPDSRLAPPRYWALHTFSHSLIREMAIHSGYGAASLVERIYAWTKEGDREAAAGILISTTSADSEGTLGGLVELSSPDIISRIVRQALLKSTSCSSDPLCNNKLPIEPEEYLHGAACHFCMFVSETSCENSNRFLDRAMLKTFANASIEGLFESIEIVRK